VGSFVTIGKRVMVVPTSLLKQPSPSPMGPRGGNVGCPTSQHFMGTGESSRPAAWGARFSSHVKRRGPKRAPLFSRGHPPPFSFSKGS